VFFIQAEAVIAAWISSVEKTNPFGQGAVAIGF
jgi:hypothetical protein